MSTPAIRVLLVEDSGFFRRALASKLESNGFVVVTAQNGDDAVHTARCETFDLVILDLHMPRLNGMAALRILRSDPATKQTPVIVLSANEKVSDKDAVMHLGASYCAKGNMTFDSLLGAIHASLVAGQPSAQAS